MYLGRRKRRIAGLAALVAAGLVAAGCSSSSSTPTGTSGTPVKGGTVTWAELPSSPANYIFPFMPLAYFSVPNSQQFQYFMYRPLYFFGGQNTSPTVDYGLSTATAPVYSNGGKTVVINMKGWKWSNGETVDANDVIFWLHMMYAEYGNWGGSGPVSFSIPWSVTSMSATGPNQVTLQLNKAYSSIWYTYNQLSQITPMPMAWDVTSLGAKAGSGGCTTDTAADKWAKCKAVYNFLAAQAKATSTYSTSPIWTVINGPFKLSSFNTDGNDSFVPNPKYSGSPKPQISVFKEVPYTSDSTEFTALKTGSLNIGYVPPADLPVKNASQVLPGSNPLGSGYKLAPNYEWGFAYYQINWKNPAMGPVFKQLYARQALEYVADQNGMSKAVYRGYAYPNTGAAPAEPTTNPWLGSAQTANGGQGPYPFNIAKATSLLTSHGWKMVGGVMTCETPAMCGAGIKAGQQFKFTLDYSTGEAAFTNEVAIYKSDASKAGIDVNIVGQTFNTIIGEAVPSNTNWQGAMYGLWIYSPDYEPTGETLFATGAGSNSGSYSDPTMDNLIAQTTTSSNISTYHTFANYAAQQLPFIYMPLTYAVTGTSANLHGVVLNPLQTLLPEYYYFTK
ncbi:MAG TPA: ABC transporter substrate-binding protein [Streptosporangiaceae bacterium]|jgi:peptide/nickel transport system substrate-binding protein|nr:ABC transporter substrate-binding protein [Streptosporangiaceae bacterium]